MHCIFIYSSYNGYEQTWLNSLVLLMSHDDLWLSLWFWRSLASLTITPVRQEHRGSTVCGFAGHILSSQAAFLLGFAAFQALSPAALCWALSVNIFSCLKSLSVLSLWKVRTKKQQQHICPDFKCVVQTPTTKHFTGKSNLFTFARRTRCKPQLSPASTPNRKTGFNNNWGHADRSLGFLC